jgi:hypothetical protein
MYLIQVWVYRRNSNPNHLRRRVQKQRFLPSFLPTSKHNLLHALHDTDSYYQPLGDNDDSDATGKFLAHFGRLTASTSPAAGLNRTFASSSFGVWRHTLECILTRRLH